MLSSSARFRWIEHRRLPGRPDVPGPANRRGGVDRHHLAGDQPIQQVTNRGEPLLDARCRKLARAGLVPAASPFSGNRRFESISLQRGVLMRA